MANKNSPQDPTGRSGHSTNPVGQYPDFSARVASRLRVGRKEYGDASFEHSPLRLIDEIQQELLDVNAWSYILWQRIEKMRIAISNRELERMERDWLDVEEGD